MSNIDRENSDFPFVLNCLEEKTAKRLLKDFTGERTGYIQVGPEKYLFPMKYAKEAQNYYNIEVRNDDIWIVTVPRSGTTLTQELVWLIGNDLNYKKAINLPLPQRFPFLEFGLFTHGDVLNEILQANAHSKVNEQLVKSIYIEGWKLLPFIQSQRFIKTHFPISLLPKDWAIKKCKTIYVARNPKNVAVSYFHLSKLFKTLGYRGEFDIFWDYFETNLLPWTPYWSHIEEAWRMRNEPHILFLFYEDIIKNLRGTIDKVAQFLGKTLTENEKTELKNHLSFENFQRNRSVNLQYLQDLQITKAEEPDFIRNGNSGKTEDKFTPELSKRADKWIAENLRRININFPNI